jgi:hypothetical protein
MPRPPRWFSPITRWSLAAALGAAWTAGAAAQFPRPAPEAPPRPQVVLDATLSPIEISRVLRSDGSSLVYRPAGDGAADAAMPRRDLAAVVPADWFSPLPRDEAAEPDPRPITELGVLHLTDGSRIVGGMPRSAATTPDRIVWSHARLGRLTFPLDRVARIDAPESDGASLRDGASPAVLPRGSAPLPARVRDRITLRNADRVEGFFVGFVLVSAPDQPPAPHARIEVDNVPREIPVDRIARIELVNPPEPARGPRVWLADGTVFSPDEVLVEQPDEITLRLQREPGGVAQVRLPATLVRAWTHEASRLTALAALPIVEHRAPPGRRWAPPPSLSQPAHGELLGAADLTLSGPVTAEWELPRGAGRLGGFLVLPDHARTWGRCRVLVQVVSVAERGRAPRTVDLGEFTLRPEAPVVRFNAALPEGADATGSGWRLRVSIVPSGAGPIQNEVVLRRWLVVVNTGQPPG